MNNECTHEEFYTQFVTPYYVNVVLDQIGMDDILNSTNEHFNDIPLKKWDSISKCAMAAKIDYDKIKATGATYSLSTFTCILKQAAQMIKDEKG